MGLRREYQRLRSTILGLVRIYSSEDTKSYTYNWWHEPADSFWIDRFIRSKIQPRQPINYYSCFGPKVWCIRKHRGHKIFFSGENLDSSRFPKYRDCRNKEVDLAIGFEFRTEANYYRFPLWIIQRDFISPTATLEDIKQLIQRLNNPSTRLSPKRDKFAVLVASHDHGKLRGRLADLISPLGMVDFGGKFRKNTNDLKEKYGDVKEEFLRNYRFNICPENSLGDGYTTEKIFECIASGCIPIYWGAYLEPGILNPDAILRYEEGKEEELYERVRTLWEDEEAYRQFAEIPPFVDGAAERIWEMIQGLETRLRGIIKE